MMLLASNATLAQKIPELELKPQKPKNWLLPSYFRIGADLIRPLSSIVDQKSSAFEFNADFDILGRFLITGDFGFQNNSFDDSFNANDRNFKLPNGQDSIISRSVNDKVKGVYYKYGIAWNLSPRNPNHSTIILGLKRAESHFDEDLNYSIQYTSWGDTPFEQSFSGTDYKVTWLELTFGAQVQVWKNLMINTVGSYKFSQSISGGNPALIPSYAPGFGKLREKTQLGISIGLMYRLNFKKPYIPIKKEKE